MGGSERLLIFAVAIGAGVGGWYLGHGAGRPPASPPADETPELVDVLGRIERLLAARAAEAREPAHASGLIVPPRAPERSEVVEDPSNAELVNLGSQAALERLTRAIVALEASLERHSAELARVQGGSRRSGLIASLAGTNLRQLDVALADLQRDPEAVRRRLMLLTRDDVLGRFGIPTDVQGFWWNYEWGEIVDEQPERSLGFSFDGDNVKWVEFRPEP